MRASIGRWAATVVVALATSLTILGVAIPIFLNPVWVSFEQDRARADAIAGYAPNELHRITGAILSDLVVGPPRFGVADDAGRPVLDDRERAHMQDVRNVFSAALAVITVAAAILVIAVVVGRRRPTLWRGIRAGARLLAAVVVLLGIVAVVAFDAAFEVFHQLFFAAGSYTFDPQTARLVQLFPDQFWSETTIALGLALLALAWFVHRIATRRLRALGAEKGGRTSSIARPTRIDSAGVGAR